MPDPAGAGRADGESGPRPHHRGNGFTNRYGRRGGRRAQLDLGFIARNRDAISVTWISHATLLVQIGGLNIITDPHFWQSAFPVQWAGPRRRMPLPVKLADLPRIDVVLLSHSHYDHLDRGSAMAPRPQPGGSPLFLAPLGVDRWLRARERHGIAAEDFAIWRHGETRIYAGR